MVVHKNIIEYKFMWYPRVLRESRYKYTTAKTQVRWLVWAYVEIRDVYVNQPIHNRFTEYYWSTETDYLKHYKLDRNLAIKDYDLY